MTRLNRIGFITILLLKSFTGFAVPDISMEVYRYQSASSPFIEVAIYVAGPSLTCNAQKSDVYGINYILVVKNEAGEVVAGNKYSLNSRGCPAKDIIDVKRFTIPSGKYTVELEATDMADTLEAVTTTQPVEFNSEFEQSHISDLTLLATVKPASKEETVLNKSGMYLEPLPFRLYYPALKQLNVYHETYDIDRLEGQPYVQYIIKPLSGDSSQAMQSFKKLKKEPVNANVFQLDISNLISGHYQLSANVFDGNKRLQSSATAFFSRLNPAGDSLYLETAASQADNSFVENIVPDSLEYYLRAMAPIISSIDNDVMNMLIKEGSDRAKRFFIYRYWTNQAGKFAPVAFEKYMVVARFIDDQYRSGLGYGFESDRGHIFLKYGAPNESLTVEDEPSAPPYEIWFYNEFPATHQANVRFLFYNPSLSHNDYKLLHSTAIGEINNSRWELELYRDATLETPAINSKVVGENVHRNARLYFDN